MNFADRLLQEMQRKGTPTCVGLDPQFERLPPRLRHEAGERPDMRARADAIAKFCRVAIDVVAPLVPAVKLNTAFFEQFFWSGVEAYYHTVQHARSRGLVAIGDVKRGDVGHTSQAYAAAHLAPDAASIDAMMLPDAVTLNPYLGADGVQPFIEAALRDGKGLFVLVQTSNESAVAVQGIKTVSGDSVAEHVARLVNQWGDSEGLVGEAGYSSIGAVVSPRPDDATPRLRALIPRSILLVPGFGAQGRGAGDVQSCFNADGCGALVTASRSVLFAYENDAYRARWGDDWERCIEAACRDFVEAIRAVACADR